MNNKLILVKYASEIFLKGLNRGKFERKLKENIEKINKELIECAQMCSELDKKMQKVKDTSNIESLKIK